MNFLGGGRYQQLFGLGIPVVVDSVTTLYPAASLSRVLQIRSAMTAESARKWVGEIAERQAQALSSCTAMPNIASSQSCITQLPFKYLAAPKAQLTSLFADSPCLSKGFDVDHIPVQFIRRPRSQRVCLQQTSMVLGACQNFGPCLMLGALVEVQVPAREDSV
eukprot:TRINITY_DN110705_c0_g1_i1.p1 TRINITY_DN110705_c0_g1~~TRINITY_DN110705_c0_g1_i1.p1  ORF type:complete len:163 (-),score=15.99 TRINITY_DN110705_c0_g1_i1:78-566(-)